MVCETQLTRPTESVGGPLVILGILSKVTSTKIQPNASKRFSEPVKLNVPVGTVTIVPAISGWISGYGHTDPDDLSPEPGPDETFVWHREDHNLGLQSINIAVTDIDAPDMATMMQTATIRIDALLSDENSDDSWFARVSYTLLCLGKAPSGVNPAAITPAPGVGGNQ